MENKIRVCSVREKIKRVNLIPRHASFLFVKNADTNSSEIYDNSYIIVNSKTANAARHFI